MKVIDFSSDLSGGEFIFRFVFEDDTDVFYTNDGWDCNNYNGLKSDNYYIELAKSYYKTVYNSD